MELYYDDNYHADSTYLEIHELSHTGGVQDYQNEIDRLYTNAKIADQVRIIIIMNKLTGPLPCSMAYYEHLRENSDE